MRKVAVAAAFAVIALAAVAPRPARAAAAGPGSIRGTFVEKPSGLALAAVEVVVRRAADSTVVAHASTADDGGFRLDGLPLDRYLLRATLLGHLALHRADLELTEAAPALDLGKQALAISAVKVPGVSTTTERSTVVIAPDRNIYLTKDMPAATAGTATDVLRAVPELDVDINGNVSLRGNSSVKVQFNGRQAPVQGDALATFLKQFPANRIERVEVIANPSAKFDPEGMAGIVNIVLKGGADLGLSGSVTLNAGSRSSSVSPRIAYQDGPVTLFGGLSGSLSRFHSSFDDQRENLLTTPLSYYRFNSASDSRNGFGMGDLSLDYAFDKRSTLYTALNGYLNSGDTEGASVYALLDSAYTATTRYGRTSDGGFDSRTGSVTLGFRHEVKADQDEWSLELRQNDTHSGNSYDLLRHNLLPVLPDEFAVSSGASGSHEQTAQFDVTRPLGAKGKLETGYRGSDRHNLNTGSLEFFHGDTLVITPQSLITDYAHHEVFHSGYLTASTTYRKLSLQGGVRAERANTVFEVISRGTHYDNDYSSVFPSANVGYDLGKGRVVRLTYSKRIERPSPYYLNPEVPSSDPLNRTAGNPYLAPKYTNAYGLEGSWTGSRGSVRVSPYYRETVHNWDQFKIVDSTGAALTTWRNAASVRAYGASLTVSLRQTGKLGGTANVFAYRERHDASNFSSLGVREANLWSANVNATYKLLPILDLQASVRYNPAQTLAQGHISALTYSYLSARLKFGEKAWANLFVNDPFNVWKYTFVTSDPAHVQTSTNHYSIRMVMAGLTWTWGKPPDQKHRRSTPDQPQQDPGVQIH
jgi:ferric enterobactin receptor